MSSMTGGGGLEGWQWMFLLEGIPIAALGIVCYFALKNNPSDAGWLTDSEKALVQRVLDSDAAGCRSGILILSPNELRYS